MILDSKRNLNESLYYDIVDVYISMYAMNPQEFIRQEKQNDN